MTRLPPVTPVSNHSSLVRLKVNEKTKVSVSGTRVNEPFIPLTLVRGNGYRQDRFTEKDVYHVYEKSNYVRDCEGIRRDPHSGSWLINDF